MAFYKTGGGGETLVEIAVSNKTSYDVGNTYVIVNFETGLCSMVAAPNSIIGTHFKTNGWNGLVVLQDGDYVVAYGDGTVENQTLTAGTTLNYTSAKKGVCIAKLA